MGRLSLSVVWTFVTMLVKVLCVATWVNILGERALRSTPMSLSLVVSRVGSRRVSSILPAATAIWWTLGTVPSRVIRRLMFPCISGLLLAMWIALILYRVNSVVRWRNLLHARTLLCLSPLILLGT